METVNARLGSLRSVSGFVSCLPVRVARRLPLSLIELAQPLRFEILMKPPTAGGGSLLVAGFGGGWAGPAVGESAWPRAVPWLFLPVLGAAALHAPVPARRQQDLAR